MIQGKIMNNPSDDKIKKLLTESKTIAIVGLSGNALKESFKVAEYLKSKGYKIIPVNPAKEMILGEECYPDLKSVSVKIDIVDVFRNIEAVPGIVEEAISIGPRAIWLQLGLSHSESESKAEKSGIVFIQSRCMKIEHSRLMR